MLKRIDLQQDTQEWLDWPNFGVGSSDIRPIRGKSQYKTKWEVFAEKLGVKKPADFSKNPHVRRGKRLEPLVREIVELKLNIKLDVFCGEDSEKPWRKVSFDGVGNNFPVEIKCPSGGLSEEEFNLLSEEEKEAAVNDRYLDLIQNERDSKLFQEYEDQLQYQIGMLDAQFGYLVFYFEHNNVMKIYRVERNDKMISDIYSDLDDFWINHIQTGEEPEKDPTRDVYTPSEDEYLTWDQETLALFQCIKEERELNKQLKEIRSEKSELVEKIYQMADKFKMLSLHSLKLTLVKGRETFDYKKFLADNDIEITEEDQKKYGKQAKASVRISPFKDVALGNLSNSVVSQQRKQAMKIFETLVEDESNSLDDSENIQYF